MNKRGFSTGRILTGISMLILIIGAYFLVQHFNSTGNALLELAPSYIPGEVIKGAISLSIQEGELIPAQSTVVAEFEGENHTLILSDLLIENTSIGEFYAEGTALNGSGNGYGFAGSQEIAPALTFSLRITYDENARSQERKNEESKNNSEQSSQESHPSEQANESSASVSQNTSQTSPTSTPTTNTSQSSPSVQQPDQTNTLPPSSLLEQPPSSQQKENNDENKKEAPASEKKEETKVEEKKEDKAIDTPKESKAEDTTNKNKGGSITGAVITEKEKIIQGTVSKADTFVSVLASGERADLVKGSVQWNGTTLPDNALTIISSTQEVRVTTKHTSTQKGFGKSFLGKSTHTIKIPLEKMNLSVQSGGSLKVQIIHQGTRIISVSGDIHVETGNNQTQEENITNATQIISGNVSAINRSTNCTSGCLTFRTKANITQAVFDNQGNADLAGTLFQQSTLPTNGNDVLFMTKNKTLAAWIDDLTGNFYLAGKVYLYQVKYCTNTSASFILKDKQGNCVGTINTTGDLWLKGGLSENVSFS